MHQDGSDGRFAVKLSWHSHCIPWEIHLVEAAGSLCTKLSSAKGMPAHSRCCCSVPHAADNAVRLSTPGLVRAIHGCVMLGILNKLRISKLAHEHFEATAAGPRSVVVPPLSGRPPPSSALDDVLRHTRFAFVITQKLRIAACAVPAAFFVALARRGAAAWHSTCHDRGW